LLVSISRGTNAHFAPPRADAHGFNIYFMDTGITIETATNHANYNVTRVANPGAPHQASVDKHQRRPESLF